MAMVADSLPKAPAANFTAILQVALAAMVEPQVPPETEKSAALRPVMFFVIGTAMF